METHSAIPYLREALIFLAAAGIAVPLLSRLKVSPVLGYLLIGGLIGPYGLGLLAADYPALSQVVISDIEGVRGLAEIGVVFLMFMIGLELSLDRLWSARLLVFGMGSLQIIVTAALIAWIAATLGADISSALVIGAALSLVVHGHRHANSHAWAATVDAGWQDGFLDPADAGPRRRAHPLHGWRSRRT